MDDSQTFIKALISIFKQISSIVIVFTGLDGYAMIEFCNKNHNIPDTTLPDVVVSSSYQSDYGMSYSEWQMVIEPYTQPS